MAAYPGAGGPPSSSDAFEALIPNAKYAVILPISAALYHAGMFVLSESDAEDELREELDHATEDPDSRAVLDEERGAVGKGFLTAAVTGSAIMFAGYTFTQGPWTSLGTREARLAYTLQWQAVSLLPAALHTLHVAASRLWGNRKAMVGIDQPSTQVATLMLQDTLQQTVLAIPAQLALTTYLGPDQMQIIPWMTSLFITGRVLFARGCVRKRKSASGRATGYALTLLPSLVAIGLSCKWLAEEHGARAQPF